MEHRNEKPTPSSRQRGLLAAPRNLEPAQARWGLFRSALWRSRQPTGTAPQSRRWQHPLGLFALTAVRALAAAPQPQLHVLVGAAEVAPPPARGCTDVGLSRGHHPRTRPEPVIPPRCHRHGGARSHPKRNQLLRFRNTRGTSCAAGTAFTDNGCLASTRRQGCRGGQRAEHPRADPSPPALMCRSCRQAWRT